MVWRASSRSCINIGVIFESWKRIICDLFACSVWRGCEARWGRLLAKLAWWNFTTWTRERGGVGAGPPVVDITVTFPLDKISLDANIGWSSRPLLWIFAGLAPFEVELDGDVLKAQEGQRGLSKDVSLSSTLSSSSRCQIFKDRLQLAILSDNDIEISFDSFPYYLRWVF